MIRISTTDIRVGDNVRTYNGQGTVIKYRAGIRPSMTLATPNGSETYCYMTAAGSVELLSDLGDRTPCESFGRW
jgi:hypothetical protein